MKPKHVPVAWRVAIDDWAVALRAAGRSKQTIETRTEHLRRCARQTGTGTPALLSRSRLIEWAGSQNWATETRRSMYASIRGFYRWAAEMLELEDISDCLPAVRPGAPCAIPASELIYRAALVAAGQAGDDRARIILRLAGEAGLRRAEIAGICRQDLIEDLTGTTIVVHGKGRKVRLVPLTDSLALDLRQFLGRRDLLFPSLDSGQSLTPRHVGKVGSRYLPDGVGLHRLRHRFSARIYESTKDLRSLQALLGHASLATTERYVPVPTDALRAAVGAAR